jgi:hypothetical protein
MPDSIYNHPTNYHNRQRKSNKKLSLGTLRKNQKTKPRSPDLVGNLVITPEVFQQLLTQHQENGNIHCDLAAWIRNDGNGLTVQLTPPFRPNKKPQQPPKSDLSAFLGKGDGQ